MNGPFLPATTSSSAYRRLLFVFAAVFLSAVNVFGQHFVFQPYEQDQGLKNRDAFKLIQDREGLLWIATENGLFRYDGSEFRRFGVEDGLHESLIVDVYQDVAGHIWAASNDQLYHLSGAKFESVSNTALHLAGGQRLTSMNSGTVLFLDRNTLLAARPDNGTEQWRIEPFFNPAQITAHPELLHPHNVFADHDGSLWLGCADRLCHVKGQEVDVLGPKQGIPSESWSVVFRDRNGLLWVRNNHHIRALLKGSASFISRDLDGDLTTATGSLVLALAEDSSGRLITQSSNGIARWEGDHWRVFDRSNGVDFNGISSVLTDRQGSLWFSTRGHGLRRWLGYDNIENWTAAQGLGHDVVWSIFRDAQHRLWLGDDLKVNLLDPKQRRIAPSPGMSGISFPQVDSIIQGTDGSIWLSNIAGQILRSQGGSHSFTRFAKLSVIARMFADASGRIWIFSRPGVYVVKSSEVSPRLEKIDDPAIATDVFTDGAQSPDGTLWFASDHHLYRYRDNRWTAIVLEPSMIQGQIRSIAAATDGSLWIGGGLQGLLHLRVDGDRAHLLNYFTCPELVSTDLQFVRFDHRGWLWVGSDLGVNVFDGVHWRLLTQFDGIVSTDISQGAFFADNDGSVWIGANGGAIHLLHPELLFSQAALQVTLQTAVLGTRVLNVNSDRNLWRWHRAPLDVSFTSLNYDRKGSLFFRYRLAGLESAWIETAFHQVHYPAVPPGSYRFEIQAIDPNQQRLSSVASFSITIRPPWWRTRPFYLVLAIICFTLSVVLWQWREHRLIRRQQMLEHLIAERTSELEAEKIELLATRETLHYQATHDALTGLWNRSAILDILRRELTHARVEGTALGVVLTDIDHFKKINDTLGHLAGDAILREAAQRMLNSIRQSDFIGRYGGEEFLIILPGLIPGGYSTRLHRLQTAIGGEHFRHHDDFVRITSSFGVTWAYPDGEPVSVEELIHRADEALYIAKAQGRDRIFFHGRPTPPSGSPRVSVQESYDSPSIP